MAEKKQVNKTIMENVLNPFILDKEMPSVSYSKLEVSGLDKQKEIHIHVQDHNLMTAYAVLKKIKGEKK